MAICLLPLLLNFLGMDFGIYAAQPVSAVQDTTPQSIDSMHHRLGGSFAHTILEWSAFCTALFTGILALVHYRIKRDLVTPIIGVALFCAGCVDVFHTLAADRLIEAVADNRNLTPFTWAISRVFNTLILIVGVGLILAKKTDRAKTGLWFIGCISLAFVLIAYGIIHYCVTNERLPQTQFPGAMISRPYDMVPLALFFGIGSVSFYALHYRKLTIFSHSLLISLVPQIATQIHMAFGSEALFDNHFNIAHFLKIGAYAVPLMGLVLDYVATSRSQQELTKTLQSQNQTVFDAIEEIEEQQRDLRTGEERFALAVRGSSSGVWDWNILTNETYFAPRFNELLGYKDDEIENVFASFQSKIHPEDQDMVLAALQRHIHDQAPFDIECRIQSKDQNYLWFRALGQAVWDDTGKATRIVGSISDITQRKKMEFERIDYTAALTAKNADLSRANAVANVAIQAKADFLANISHELRTPLTAILGYAEMLTNPDQNKQNHAECVDIINRNGQHLLSVIDDILDISKIKSDSITLERQTCSPLEILAKIASKMRVRATGKNLTFSVEYVGPIPKTIQTDPARLRQVLINLVGNAIKFTETGGVRLTTKMATPPDSPTPQLRIEVIDTGIGITQAQQAKIFQVFSQADESSTRKYGGMGMGLMISRRLVQILGGDISVQSTPGQGSSFIVTIETGPLNGVEMFTAPTEAGDDTTMTTPAHQGKKPTSLAGRILLAEDGPDNQRLISFVLKKAGAQVTVADNGRIAYEKAMQALNDDRPFDLIFMDIQMPELDGHAATRLLRESGYKNPIIALTAHAMSGDRQKCIDAGCDDYTTKPIDRPKLIELAAKYLHSHKQNTAA